MTVELLPCPSPISINLLRGCRTCRHFLCCPRQHTLFSWSCLHISGMMIPWMSRHVHETEQSNNLHSYVPLKDVDEKEVDDLGLVHEDIPLNSPKPPVLGTDRSYGLLEKVLYAFRLLLPSFLRRNSNEPRKLHSTAWLGRCPRPVVLAVMLPLKHSD